MNHPTPSQLQDYLDGLPGDFSREDIGSHLHSCVRCRAQVDALEALDAALRNVPPEQVSAGFTGRVMASLGVSESSTLLWKLLKNLAPLVALTLVIGIVAGVLGYFGLFEGTQVEQSVIATQSAYTVVGGKVSAGIAAMNGWLERYASFAFAGTSYGMTAFLVAFLGAVALLDKFLFMPLMRRRV